jgi:hypothetical protein
MTNYEQPWKNHTKTTLNHMEHMDEIKLSDGKTWMRPDLTMGGEQCHQGVLNGTRFGTVALWL